MSKYGSFKTKLEYITDENFYYLGANKSKIYKAQLDGNGKELRLTNEQVFACVRYAYSMAKENKQRENRSGGSHKRNELEIFWDAFRGKIAESYAKRYFEMQRFTVSDIDFKVYERGEWDNYDLLVNGHVVAIKSSKHFSQLLLLETKDWNDKGEYTGNKGHDEYTPEWFLFVRTRITEKNGSFKCDKLGTLEEMSNLVSDIDITAELTGSLSFNDFVNQVIKYKYIIKRGARFKATRSSEGTIMDAENYYVKLSELESVESMMKKIQKQV